jgi:hypothetical protein
MTKIELYDIANLTTLESNKSLHSYSQRENFRKTMQSIG